MALRVIKTLVKFKPPRIASTMNVLANATTKIKPSTREIPGFEAGALVR
jgi:hypothetical protein